MRTRHRQITGVVLLALGLGAWASSASGGDTPTTPKAPTAAERGYRKMLDKAFLPAWFAADVFDRLWEIWPEPLRGQAEAADAPTRRRMTLERYGLDERPAEASGLPLQFTATEKGGWTLNCFACHGGSVRGQVIPGLPNSHYAYATLSEEVRKWKLQNKRPLTPFDAGGMMFPLGKSNGTTNAVVFSIALLQFRDKDLNVVSPTRVPRFPHHDLDAPPWWHYHKRERIYVDGFGKKNARTLMQFTLVPQNTPKVLHAWESDFEDIAAYLSSIRAPKYPLPIDADRAAAGRSVFRRNCAKCHGTYGETPRYPNKDIPIDEIGTDRARYDAIRPEERRQYADSWLTNYDATGIVIEPKGYVAPPLDGIWASAPYLHNGSVPTLWHLLRPTTRPKVWRRKDPTGYDATRVGLAVETFDAVPETAKTGAQKRTYFDTAIPGKGAAGHDYPAKLTEEERVALLEYLKTL